MCLPIAGYQDQVYLNHAFISILITKVDSFCSMFHWLDMLILFSRLQAQPLNTASAYQGMSDVFWRTLQNEGFRGLYKGILPNLLKVVPSASITYMVYESMKKSLGLE